MNTNLKAIDSVAELQDTATAITRDASATNASLPFMTKWRGLWKSVFGHGGRNCGSLPMGGKSWKLASEQARTWSFGPGIATSRPSILRQACWTSRADAHKH